MTNATRTEIDRRIDILRPLMEAGVSDANCLFLSKILGSPEEAMDLLTLAKIVRQMQQNIYQSTPHVINTWVSIGHAEKKINLIRMKVKLAQNTQKYLSLDD